MWIDIKIEVKEVNKTNYPILFDLIVEGENGFKIENLSFNEMINNLYLSSIPSIITNIILL